MTDSTWNDLPTCPHCGDQRVDWTEESGLTFDGDEVTLTCGSCGGLFDVRMCVDVTFHSTAATTSEVHVRELKDEILRTKGIISLYSNDPSETSLVIVSTFGKKLAAMEAMLKELEKES